MAKITPNQYGVYPDAEVLKVVLPKAFKARVEIRIAEGEDCLFRWGYSYQFGTHGACALPSLSGKSFATRGEAFADSGLFLETRVKECRELNQKTKTLINTAIRLFVDGEIGAPFSLSNGDCGHDRPYCPVNGSICDDCMSAGPAMPTNATDPGAVIDNRRLRKAYLVGRDKYFIWRGHYRHEPQCSAWGFTEHIEDAYRFESLQACIDYWRSRHNFPKDYEHCIWDGYLTFFEETKRGLRRVMPVPEQGELF